MLHTTARALSKGGQARKDMESRALNLLRIETGWLRVWCCESLLWGLRLGAPEDATPL